MTFSAGDKVRRKPKHYEYWDYGDSALTVSGIRNIGRLDEIQIGTRWWIADRFELAEPEPIYRHAVAHDASLLFVGKNHEDALSHAQSWARKNRGKTYTIVKLVPVAEVSAAVVVAPPEPVVTPL